MVRLEGKKKTIVLFFVLVCLPSYALFSLVGTGSFSDYVETSFYIALVTVCLVLIGAFLTSDDEYYQNLDASKFVGAIALGVGMVALSWGLSIRVENPTAALLSAAMPMGIMPSPTSMSSEFLSLVIFGLAMVATGEELLKLTMFAELKARWGKGYKIGALTIPGVLIFVGIPVGFWAALHGLEAYNTPIMIIPAFVNGILLIVYLWKTKCILGCILAHWTYNSSLLAIAFLNGSASYQYNIPVGTPLFPAIFNGAYYSNSGYIEDMLLFAIVAGAFLFFLLPSLFREKSSRKYKR